MKTKFFLPLLLFALTLVIPFNGLAQEPQENETKNPKKLVPFTYVTEPDGTKVPVYLVTANEKTVQKAIAAGVITEQEAMYAHKLENSFERAGVLNSAPDSCPNIATQRAAGWDADNDYYKDYEHPEGLEYAYCVTVWYQVFKGSPSSYLLAPHYGPGLFRRHMIIGLSGFPTWFADEQAYLIFTNIS